MTFDDFKNELKNIDLRNPGAMPLPIKLMGIALVCLLILFLGYWTIIKDELAEYDAAQQKEQELRDAYLKEKLLAINLPVYKQQMVEMKQTFGAMLRELPNTNEVPDLLIDITQAGLGRGLDFVLFKPEKEKPVDFYAELPISIKVNGSYHQLAQFVSDVSALPRIVTLQDISINADKGSRLSMSLTAKTFRYIEGETAASTSKTTMPNAPTNVK